MTLRVDDVPLVEDRTEAVAAQAADHVDLAGMARAVDRGIRIRVERASACDGGFSLRLRGHAKPAHRLSS